MRIRPLLATVALSVLAGASTMARQAPRDALLVSPAALARDLTDPNLVVLHVGSRADYDRAHVPGARFVALGDLAAPRAEGALNLEMLPADALHAKLAALGISDTSRIVVTFTGTSVTMATRVVLTLDYAGLGARTRLLDGGVAAWVAGGHPVTTEEPRPVEGRLSPLRTRPLIVTADELQTRMGTAGVKVVDARLNAFYQGTQTGGGQALPHKTGHITGAVNVPFVDLTDASLQFKSTDELAAIFAGAGVRPGDTVITYCHIGQQATAALFAARLLGHAVLLYDGSFEDWSKRDLPVANPSKRAP